MAILFFLVPALAISQKNCPTPNQHNLTLQGFYCGSTVTLALDAFDPNVSYQLINSSNANIGAPQSSSSASGSIVFSNVPVSTTPTTYYVLAQPFSYCPWTQLQTSFTATLPSISTLGAISTASTSLTQPISTSSFTVGAVSYQNSSSGITYSWSITPGAGTITGVGTSATVSWNSTFTGAANISVTANYSCNGSNQASNTSSIGVTVAPNPANFCTQTYTLTASGTCNPITFNLSGSTSGVTYTLNGPGLSTAQVLSGTGGVLSWPGLNLTAGGTYIVSSASTGCSTANVGSTTLTLNSTGQPGAIQGPATVALPATASSSYSVSAATNATGYTWSLSNTSAGTIPSNGNSATVTWSPSFVGSVTVSCTANGSCNSVAATALPVSVSQTPTITGPLSVQQTSANTTSAYSVTTVNNATYNWTLTPSTSGTISGNGTSATVTWNASYSGNATIAMVATSSGSTATATPLTVSVSPVPQPLTGGTIVSSATSVLSGGTVTLSVGTLATGGTGPITYQWQSSPDGGNTWTFLSNYISSPGTITSNPITQPTTFRWLVSCNGSFQQSNNILVSLNSSANITGPAAVQQPTASSQYSVTAVSGASYSWSLTPPSAGTITGNNANATVTWGSSFSGGATVGVSITNSGSTSSASPLAVNVISATPQPLTGGTIVSSSSSVVGGGTVTLSVGTLASGGTGPITYQWQSSTDGGNTWAFLSNYIATPTTLTSGPLTQATTFRWLATSNGAFSPSNSILINIGAASPTISGNTSVTQAGSTSTYSVSAVSGATYSWSLTPTTAGTLQSSGASASIAWSASFSGNATLALSINTSGTMVAATPLSISVGAPTNQPLTGGTIIPSSTTVASGGTVTFTVGTLATGGTGPITYQWQSSTDGGNTWTFLSNYISTPSTLVSSPITQATTFRWLVTSNGAFNQSNNVLVSLGAPTTISTPGTFSTTTYNVPANNSPFTITVSAPPNSGSTNYIWFQSTDGLKFTPISSSNSLSYSVPTLNSTTYFKVGFTSGSSATSYSNVVTVNVSNSPSLGTSLPSNLNYILTSTPRVAGIANPSSPNNPVNWVNQTVQYMDYLDRPIQTVTIKGNPTATADEIQPMAYDAFGREPVKYLPYTNAGGSPGAYHSQALSDNSGNYNNSEQYQFYQSTVGNYSPINAPSEGIAFEASPLNRVLEKGSPGSAWQLGGATNKTLHTSNDGVTYWAKKYLVTLTPGSPNQLIDGGNYGNNELYVTITKNENWTSNQPDPRLNTMEEYKDLEGHMILKRTYNYPQSTKTMEILSTYYVYDDLGNLDFVLTPGSNPDGSIISAWNQSVLDNLCYQYQYDYRNRLVTKKIPGKGWEYMVYDINNQLVARQDANLASKNLWEITKYDVLERPILRAIYNTGSNTLTQSAFQNQVLGETQFWEKTDNTQKYGYTLTQTFPNSINNLLSVNYYDNYNIPNFPSNFVNSNTCSMTRGLATASITTVLNTLYKANRDSLWIVNYYDSYGKDTLNYSSHYLGGVVNSNNYDKVNTKFNDITGEVLSVLRNHYTSGGTGAPSLIVETTYSYDHMGRKIQSYEQINGGPKVLVSQLDYNELNQLITKHLNLAPTDAQFLKTISYNYNERGWLLGLNTSDNNLKFNLALSYNNPTNGSVPQFNGNISQMNYTIQNAATTRSFAYAYDYLNRLISANAGGVLDESNISYDLNGNIYGLYRGGNFNQGYNYSYMNGWHSSNQIATVTSWQGVTVRNYTYDLNGNITADTANRTITYNLLNLPENVYLGGSSPVSTNYYDANGTKLRTVGSDGSWDYIKGIIYNNQAIKHIQTEEGRALPNGSGFNYQYYLKDHLGNNRITFDRNPDGSAHIDQEDEYYAFGMVRELMSTSPPNKFQYNGKEWQVDLKNMYDYGARFYDPLVARWTSIDPLAEKGRRWSPYTYGFDNPIRFEDPDGMWPDWNELGKNVSDFFKGIGSGLQQKFGIYKMDGNTTGGHTRFGIVNTTLGRLKKDGNPVGKPVVRFDVGDKATPYPHINGPKPETNFHISLPGGARTLGTIESTGKVLNGLNKAAVPVALTIDAISIHQAYSADGNKVGDHTVVAVSGAVGSWAGAISFGAAGTELGAGVGLLGGPLAPITVPVGGFLGGLGFGIYGSFVGRKFSEDVAKDVIKNN